MINISTDKLPLAGFEVTFNDDPEMETLSLMLFVSGCTRTCKGCQNPELQKPREKDIMSISAVKKIIDEKSKYIGSVSFSGGDFLPLYENQLKQLISYCIILKLKTILYTGEKYNDINNWFKENIDIIVSEPFDINRKQSKYPASSNQKVWIKGIEINPNTLKINKIEY